MHRKSESLTEEERRLRHEGKGPVPEWRKWGPYVSERSWGSVREDYSGNGDAWSYFPFDIAQQKAYRWGEDAIAGWCDRYQILVFAPVFWNGRDPILKERLYGLNAWEGNHGEDVKEYYYHLDATPTHSYMKFLYKYPQDEFPYQKLREENKRRTSFDPEYELIDTGIFDQNRYFDIFIEYAKASPEDTCIKIEVFNRGDHPAPLDVLGQLWFRNSWAWGEARTAPPKITAGAKKEMDLFLIADEDNMPPPKNLGFTYQLGKRYLYGKKDAELLFTENETHEFGHEVPSHYYKDGIQRYLIRKEKTVNPSKTGTKACLHYHFDAVSPKSSVVLYFRLTDKEMSEPLKHVEEIIASRKKEADQFYHAIHPKKASDEEKMIQRQAFAGMLWSKQIYLFDVNLWLKGDNPLCPPPSSREHIRNIHWRHLNSMRILSMPDKWEYPWFAAWDQAFHSLVLGLIDIEFAKEQLWLLLFDQFQHPNITKNTFEMIFIHQSQQVNFFPLLFERDNALFD